MNELEGLGDIVAEIGLENQRSLEGAGVSHQFQWIYELSQLWRLDDNLRVVVLLVQKRSKHYLEPELRLRRNHKRVGLDENIFIVYCDHFLLYLDFLGQGILDGYEFGSGFSYQRRQFYSGHRLRRLDCEVDFVGYVLVRAGVLEEDLHFGLAGFDCKH